MDIRRYFGAQPSTKNVVGAGSSKSTESGAQSKRSSEKSRKATKAEKGKDDRKRKASKTSESDGDEAAKDRRNRKHRKKTKTVLDSDSSGEEPLPPKLRKTSGESTKNKKVHDAALISSDEEEALPSRLNKATKKEDSFKTVSKETSVIGKSPVKEIKNVSEYFGTKPVERTMRNTHATKRKERCEEFSSLQKAVKQSVNSTNNVEDETVIGLNSPEKELVVFSEQPTKKAKTSFSDTESAIPPSQCKEKVVEHSKETQSVRTAEREESKPSSNPAKSAAADKHTHVMAKSTTLAKSTTPSKSTTPMKSTPDVLPPSLEKQSSYRSFMMREGPQALGSKEIPKGTDSCLGGLVFVVTGVLESIERDDVQDLIKRHGGKVTQSVSKKTSHILVGRDPGQSKLSKARQLGTSEIDEDGLFDMIRSSTKESTKASDSPKVSKEKKLSTSSSTPKNSSQTSVEFSPSQGNSQSTGLSSTSSTPATQTPSASPLAKGVESDSLLWVDKYSPKSIKQIIGQQGGKSNVNKLLRWLMNWHSNQRPGKQKGGYFAGKEDGSIFKAALLSGPPGVGKTTSAHLVCQECGYSFIEFNASDSRSKKTLEEHISEVLDNKTMDGFILTTGPKFSSEKHVLIMDEVDGMAGNEDRGGMQELISLIKSTKIPIICMCNDRNSQKVRSLANYCFDLRFQRPRVEQIKGAMMSIAFKEKLTILPQAMEKIIVGANHDIRQVLHNLSMWTSKQKTMNYDEAKANADRALKDIKMGPFDVTRKIFAAEESSKMNIHEYFSLFFNDYSLIPLFTQENYVQVVPFSAGSPTSPNMGNPKKTLKCLSDAAESLCDADLVEKTIRSNGSWNLLPLQSFFSCVLPGKIMKGKMSKRIDFPSWLGKNSTTGKNSRILQEILSHTQLSTSGSKLELNLDYIPHLRRALSLPLINADSENCSSKVSEVIKIMDNYHLMKEDWESILEVGHFEGKLKLQSEITSKTKAAFTRAYNKEAHLAPYSSQTTAKKKSGRSITEIEPTEMGNNEVNEENGDSDDADIEHNSMIKVKKASSKAGGSAGRGNKSKTNQANSVSKQTKAPRGKGVSKGKGKGKSK